VPGREHPRRGNRRVDAAAHRGNDAHQLVCLVLVAT
jgi:hypothetical protein